MKISELKSKIAEIEARQVEISAMEELTDEVRSEFENISDEKRGLAADLKIKEVAENINLQEAQREIVEEPKEESLDLVSGLREFFSTGQAPKEFRSARGGFVIPQEVFTYRDNLTSTKGSGVLEKAVNPAIQIAKTPAEGLLESLGVTMYNGLQGQFVLPRMAQVSSTSPGETLGVADASANPTGLTLAPVRTGAYQVFTKELLAQTNPGVYTQIVQDLYDSVWRQVGAAFFDNLQLDTPDASVAIAGGTLAYEDFVDLQANVPYDLGSAAYVATPAVAAFAKKTATIASVNGPIWEGSIMDGMVDGIPAVGTALANTDHLIYGDFSKAAVGSWGSIELIVNPYEFDAEGMIKVTASGLFDSGAANYRFFSWIADVSI